MYDGYSGWAVADLSPVDARCSKAYRDHSSNSLNTLLLVSGLVSHHIMP